MNRVIAIVLVCLATSVWSCGGATPEPETAANVDTTSTDNEAGEGASSGDPSSSDPQTTEEVIESSEPLD